MERCHNDGHVICLMREYGISADIIDLFLTKIKFMRETMACISTPRVRKGNGAAGGRVRQVPGEHRGQEAPEQDLGEDDEEVILSDSEGGEDESGEMNSEEHYFEDGGKQGGSNTEGRPDGMKEAAEALKSIRVATSVESEENGIEETVHTESATGHMV